MRLAPRGLGLASLSLLACSYAAPGDTDAVSTLSSTGFQGTTAGPAGETNTDEPTTTVTPATSTDAGASTSQTSLGESTDSPSESSTTAVDSTAATETTVSDTTAAAETTTSTDGTAGETETETGGTTVVPPGCENAIKDGDETDIDCGGSCPACEEGQACVAHEDCASKSCAEQVCVAPTCDDGLENGSESDVDCGGFDCGPCEDGLSCNAAGDCASLVCEDQICSPPTCDDGQKNASESDVDCGGPDCAPCGDGLACAAPADCESGVCEAELCVAATCSDGAENGEETGVDCGGPTCAPCQLATLVINEVDYDQPNDDAAEFIEIYNNTGAAVNLQGLAVLLVNGVDSKVYRTIDLSPGVSLAQGGYLVVANPNFVAPPGVVKIDTPVVASGFIQNGAPDGVALVDSVNKVLLDALSYEGAITMAALPFATTSLVGGTALPANVADVAAGSLSRIPNGNDKNNAATDWKLSATATPGLANVP